MTTTSAPDRALTRDTVLTLATDWGIRAIERGEYDLVYVAPERFRSGRFVESVGRIRLALLAVDAELAPVADARAARPPAARRR